MSDSNQEQPRLFNKAAILTFSILMSTFFGALMFSQNLASIGKKNEIIKVILFAGLWNLIFFRLSGKIISNPLISFIIINLLGGIVLIFPMWNHYFQGIT